MRRWVSSNVADPNMVRETPRTYVVDTMRGTDVAGLTGLPSDASVLQSPAGDIGGMILAGVLLVVLGLAGVAVWQGRMSAFVGQFSGSTRSESGSNSATDGVESDGPATPAEPEQETEPEPTDQEVIVDILEGNEGRMKQARIVDATGWSKSKVSMLLSEMEDDGHISKLRVGRENIISLQGKEPDAAGSPFDDE